MKLSQLRNIVAIAEHGSLRAAARALGVAQPALTRSLSDLERRLGAPLFERRVRGMITTAPGQSLVNRASAILNDVRRAEEEFEQLRGNAIGLVTIALSIAAHMSLLPKALRPFRQRYPNVRLHIIEGFYPVLEPRLLDASVDFYIGPDPGAVLPSALRKETALLGERAVLCRKNHPLAKAVSLKELQHAEWITTSITPKAEHELGDLFARYGLREPVVTMQSQSALTLFTCLANSDLLAMAPAQLTKAPFSNGALATIDVSENLSAAPLTIVTRVDAPLAPAANHLLDLMKRSAGYLNAAHVQTVCSQNQPLNR